MTESKLAKQMSLPRKQIFRAIQESVDAKPLGKRKRVPVEVAGVVPAKAKKRKNPTKGAST